LVTCTFCSAPAVYMNKATRTNYCKEHFIKYFEYRIEDTLLKYVGERNLKGKIIAVATSGGKDSTSLLQVLSKLSKKYEFDVIALAVDEGIKGYRDVKLDFLKRIVARLEVTLYIESFAEWFGRTLDEMVMISLKKGFEIKPCTLCGVFRRYILNVKAREIGANYLATGHNLDDEGQVFLMNILRGSIKNLLRESGVLSRRMHEKLVPRLKPLYFLSEKETTVYSVLMQILPPPAECPYVVFASRNFIRKWLNVAEMENPGIKMKLLEVKEELCEKLVSKTRLEIMVPKLCNVCGEPSAEHMCKACQLRTYLGLKYNPMRNGGGRQ